MKTAALLTAFAASVAAFSPVTQQIAKSTAVNAFSGELGDQPPIGFWDPLNFCEDGDAEKFERYRYVELKHGRICMLAFLGEVTTRAGIHLPGQVDYAGDTFDSIPNGWAAIGALPKEGVVQLLLFVGFLELFIMKDITGGEFPGDFRNDWIDYGWDTFDPAEQESKRAIELANGRGAMMGVITLLVADQAGIALPIIG
mmetsp:Transcript_33054/g.37580  ORF Transcript_33054/g.37580 Transcript_33054/m.37580 type:complete len:199 (+) Transcript_33054:26-622(+)|eukprot:CAMPEP_0194140196 /NCGR_PEP_ID=MMETSP0152-20130528/9765_1 /TAXON_ID=1049557 /ORGANISM="Thalassiothrix antarctica, Strain L6-D1" /LENGTH=198 /DNA_ID=CAMNT_0038838351 /DNA_START=34 /DNA_END=630 /DNA_ORIENTATION=+